MVDGYLNISKAIDNPEDYLYLSDGILGTIERSKAPELEESRRILRNLRTRNLYKFVDEFLIPPDLEPHLNKVISLSLLYARIY